MTPVNPFAQKFERLQVPPHMGKSVSVRGITVEADADGVIEVPVDVARELLPHGLTKAPEKAAKK